MKRTVALAVLLAGVGCAYYNGMYNANRLARQAEKAERQGRTFQADGLWAQAAVRAESVLVHHPNSKWADDAMLLRGRAYKKRNDCPSAIPSLQNAVYSSPDSALVAEAALLLAECYVETGNLIAADAVLGGALDTEDSLALRRARLTQAKIWALAGRYEEALELYSNIDPQPSDGIRLLAVAGGGSLGHAASLTDTLVARRDTTVPWDSVLAVAGRRDLRAASALTDRLLEDPDLRPEVRARWLLADGLRLSPADAARATERLRAASSAGDGRTPSGSQARLALARLDLAGVADADELAEFEPKFLEWQALGGAGGFEIGRLVAAMTMVRRTVDSVGSDTPQGDLEWFLAAETARDFLRMPRLASRLFQRLAELWPASPYAPKALLAVADVQPELGPALHERLIVEYGQSPYVAAITGAADPFYRVLEDSLRSFAASRLASRPADQARPPQPERPERPRPGQDRRLGEEDVQ